MLCRLYYTAKTAWKKPPSMVEDAFRISGQTARRARI